MRRKISGEITVFLSLILVMMMSLVFTLLESARSEGLKLRVQLVANSCIESVFAQYDRCLWDEYGLMLFAGRDGGGEELSQIALSYAEENSGSSNDEELSLGTDWLSFVAEDVEVKNNIKITDANGDVFIKAISDYMTSCGLIEAAIDSADAVKSLGGDSDASVSDEDGEIDLSKISEKIKNAESDMQEVEDDEEASAEYEISDEEAKKKYEELKNTLNSWIRRGLLGVVCDDVGSISETLYDLEDLPSSLSNSEKSRDDGDVGSVSSLDKILCKEYIIQNFDDYEDKSDKGLELEYIICGKDSDLANFSSIVKRIIAIRTGIDYVRIRTDGSKVAEALAIATAVAGWTLVPSIVTAVKEIILVIWAVADGISDTKKVIGGEEDDDDFSYADYLHAFLYLVDSEDIAYRTMDVIQRNVRNSEDAFRMSNCTYAANIILKAQAKSLFPFLPTEINYEYQMGSAYSYGKVNSF